MRILFHTLIVCILNVIGIIYALAAPTYGTRLAPKHRFILGIQSHTIINRDLEDNYGKIRSLQHFLQLSYGLTDWLTIDLKGGAGYIKQHPPHSNEIDYPSSFSGGYGFRLRVVDIKRYKMRVVLGFEHISVHPYTVRIEGIRNKAVLDDWEGLVLLSKDVGKFTPYIGTKYSRIDYIHWQEDSRKRKMSDLTKPLGLIIGVDCPFFYDSWLNLEGYFFDEKAVAIAVQFLL